MPRIVPARNAVPAPTDPAPAEGDLVRGARHHPIPLDVAYRGQRLLAYVRGEVTEGEAVNAVAVHARHPARPRRPLAGQQLLEAADR